MTYFSNARMTCFSIIRMLFHDDLFFNNWKVFAFDDLFYKNWIVYVTMIMSIILFCILSARERSGSIVFGLRRRDFGFEPDR